MKTLFYILMSLLCLCFALIPETVMVAVYFIVDPVTFTQKLMTFVAFALVGGGTSLVFGFLGITIWVALMDGIRKW